VEVLAAGAEVLAAGVEVLAAGAEVLAAGVEVLAAGAEVLAAGAEVLAAGVNEVRGVDAVLVAITSFTTSLHSCTDLEGVIAATAETEIGPERRDTAPRIFSAPSIFEERIRSHRLYLVPLETANVLPSMTSTDCMCVSSSSSLSRSSSS
jgi:hypothetical protein